MGIERSGPRESGFTMEGGFDTRTERPEIRPGLEAPTAQSCTLSAHDLILSTLFFIEGSLPAASAAPRLDQNVHKMRVAS